MTTKRLFLFLVSSFVVAMIFYYAKDGFAYQLLVSRIFTTIILAITFFFFWKNPALIRDFFGVKDRPYNIAIFRILFFSTWAIPIMVSPANDIVNFLNFPWIELPSELRSDILATKWMYGLVELNDSNVEIVQTLCKIAAVFSLFGLFTRVSTLIFALGIIYILGIPWNFGQYYHYHYQVAFAAILAFSPCGDALSLDSLIKKFFRFNAKPNDVAYSTRYALPLRMIWLFFGIMYFFPGFWKIWNSGFDWMFSNNIQKLMYYVWIEFDGWVPFFRIDHWPILCQLGALFIVAFEFSFIFLIFNRTTRRIAVLLGVLTHLSIAVFLNINFGILFIFYGAFVDWNKHLFRRSIDTPLLHQANSVKTVFRSLISENKLMSLFAVFFFAMNIYLGLSKKYSWPLTCFPTFDISFGNDTTFSYLTYQKKGEQVDIDRHNLFIDALGRHKIRMQEDALISAFDQMDQSNYDINLQSISLFIKNKVGNEPLYDSINLVKNTAYLSIDSNPRILSTEVIGTIALTSEYSSTQ